MVSQGEGWTGMLIITDGKFTFTLQSGPDHLHPGALAARCTPVAIPCVAHAVSAAPQVLLKHAQITNVYNYDVKNQTPMVREHHKGPAVPTWGECDINFFMAKLKTAAETVIPEGLGI